MKYRMAFQSGADRLGSVALFLFCVAFVSAVAYWLVWL